MGKKNNNTGLQIYEKNNEFLYSLVFFKALFCLHDIIIWDVAFFSVKQNTNNTVRLSK